MKNQAFTLIELLVVILIIGILAAIALPQYKKVVDKARYLQLMLVGKKIFQAQQMYKLENGHYAASAADLEPDLPSGYKLQPFSGVEAVWVYDKFYCHTGVNSTFCWMRQPVVGFIQVNDPKKPGRCILCRSSNAANLSRAERMCLALSKQKELPSGDCISVPIQL